MVAFLHAPMKRGVIVSQFAKEVRLLDTTIFRQIKIFGDVYRPVF